jgi:hypothetical protein
MCKSVLINELEHFTLAFANEAFLLSIFGFLGFAKITLPTSSWVQARIVAMFMDLGFADRA